MPQLFSACVQYQAFEGSELIFGNYSTTSCYLLENGAGEIKTIQLTVNSSCVDGTPVSQLYFCYF